MGLGLARPLLPGINAGDDKGNAEEAGYTCPEEVDIKLVFMEYIGVGTNEGAAGWAATGREAVIWG